MALVRHILGNSTLDELLASTVYCNRLRLLASTTATAFITMPSIHAIPEPSADDYRLFDKLCTKYIFHRHTDEPLITANPGDAVFVCKSTGQGRSPELFLRARVVETLENKRIKVQYPKGSTYECQPCNLLPVLEHVHHQILVLPETPEYRRACAIHTQVDEEFLEIGCDYGLTVAKVHQFGVKHVWGLDKSETSIAVARERYPELEFELCDILVQDPKTKGSPKVVAMDINGNRDLPAVLHCCQRVVELYEPRLIIVKSRALDALLQEKKKHE